MSGMAEIQELMSMVQEINALLTDTVAKVNKIEAESGTTAEAVLTVQQFLRIMYRIEAILKKMGLPEDVGKAINAFSKVTHAAMMAWMSIRFLEMSTTYGLIFGLLGLATTGFYLGDMATEAGSYG
jgi:hypothetical protein